MQSVSLSPVVAQFESLALTDVWVEDGAEADTAVTVALRWRLDTPVSESLNVSLQLQDVDGWPLASIDQEIVNENGRPTQNWQAGHNDDHLSCDSAAGRGAAARLSSERIPCLLNQKMAA